MVGEGLCLTLHMPDRLANLHIIVTRSVSPDCRFASRAICQRRRDLRKIFRVLGRVTVDAFSRCRRPNGE